MPSPLLLLSRLFSQTKALPGDSFPPDWGGAPLGSLLAAPGTAEMHWHRFEAFPNTHTHTIVQSGFLNYRLDDREKAKPNPVITVLISVPLHPFFFWRKRVLPTFQENNRWPLRAPWHLGLMPRRTQQPLCSKSSSHRHSENPLSLDLHRVKGGSFSAQRR